jgi:hypothetical protein
VERFGVRAAPALEADFEAVWASDIRLFQGAAAAGFERGAWQTRVDVSVASIGFDYQPNAKVDSFTLPRSINEPRYGGQIGTRWRPADRLTLIGGAGGYSGFTSHRSAWINEWYQQWFAGLTGLRDAGPYGANATLGARWEYLPAAGFAQVDLTYARDRIAPGYDEVIDPEFGLVGVVPLRDDLNTWAAKVTFENVLTRRLRSQLEFRFADQSERGLRVGGVAALNYAFAENWVARTEAGYVHEALDESNVPATVRTEAFEGWWAGGSIERQLGEHWFLSATGHYYRDNGEIESSISFSSAAPPVRGIRLGLGLRWLRERHAFKLFGGTYFVEHDPVDFGILFFKPLYRDRTFGVAQIAYTYEF